MSRHYFTFGYAHAHAVNGRTWDKDCVCVIEADAPEKARERMMEAFGPMWAMQYDHEPNMAYFPRGLMFLDATDDDVRSLLRTLGGGRSSRDSEPRP